MPDNNSAPSYEEIPGSLEVRGYATDHIWALTNEAGEIGLRFDCGDSGTLFLTKRQAHEVINVLNEVLSQL